VFVKNLENVQGDERDVMLFSVCYGPDATGRVTMNFGPLNRKGGERRLNVAVTRARRRLVVYSTLDWTQVNDHGSSALGVAHLKSFLRYAKEGATSLLATTTAPGHPDFGSPFEREVHDVLVAAGHRVHSQVGCSGYRIDLAIVDPARPGAYLLAIETDGATYHGTRAARARDRLRQQVLESLGWRFHRVWSTDWWHDRRGETERLLAAVAAAARGPRASLTPTRAQPTTSASAPPVATAAAPTERAASTSNPPSFAAQVAASPTIALPPEATRWEPVVALAAQGTREQFQDDVVTASIAALFSATVATYGPLSVDTACRRVASVWGLQLGSRIRARIVEAAPRLPTNRQPTVVGEFVWPAGVRPDSWRGFRVADEGSGRDVEDVPVEEVVNVAVWVLSAAVSCSREALVKEVGARLGIGSRSRAARTLVEAGVDRLVRERRGRVDGEKIVAV
jgi:very-short-patch-repair endonuclease